MKTVLDCLKSGTRYLEGRHIEDSRSNMQWLMAHQLGCTRTELYMRFDRPLEEVATLVSPLLDDERLVTCCDRLDPYVEGPDHFAVFRDFSVEEGLRNSPELRALDAAIARAADNRSSAE